MSNTCQAVSFTAREKADLITIDFPSEPGPNEVRGRTLMTLVSPGTELAAYTDEGDSFPKRTGYGAVVEVEQCGSEVAEIQPGDRVFYMGKHQSLLQAAQDNMIKIPAELSTGDAVLVRLMNVSMTTLMTTTARPGDLIIVSGFGPVGYLATQVFLISGYEVTVIEPDDRRRGLASQVGITHAFSSMPLEDSRYAGNVSLVVECSGHEQAVLDAINIVRAKGEVVMVGVPWRKQSDLDAHTLLYKVFYNYPVLRSGWELELPRHETKFQPHSIFTNLRKGLRWLSEGKIHVDGMVSTNDPRDCQSVYQDHLHHRNERPCSLFDWTKL